MITLRYYYYCVKGKIYFGRFVVEVGKIEKLKD